MDFRESEAVSDFPLSRRTTAVLRVKVEVGLNFVLRLNVAGALGKQILVLSTYYAT